MCLIFKFFVSFWLIPSSANVLPTVLSLQPPIVRLFCFAFCTDKAYSAFMGVGFPPPCPPPPRLIRKQKTVPLIYVENLLSIPDPSK